MSEVKCFEYGSKEIEYLKSKDKILGEFINKVGRIKREVITDLFVALINSIVGQQISAKAHKTVWQRMNDRFVPFTANTINEATLESIQECGVSFKKAAYIKGIALSVINCSLDLKGLNNLEDDEVIKKLSSLNGIGKWTAEMLMVFSMQRPNIISYGDLAILNGLKKLYHHKKITPGLFLKYKKRYSPYATVASLYLWHISSMND